MSQIDPEQIKVLEKRLNREIEAPAVATHKEVIQRFKGKLKIKRLGARACLIKKDCQ